jgi:hypothetical protein
MIAKGKTVPQRGEQFANVKKSTCWTPFISYTNKSIPKLSCLCRIARRQNILAVTKCLPEAM